MRALQKVPEKVANLCFIRMNALEIDEVFQLSLIHIFYGASEFGPSVYQYYVFVALATTLFTASVTILQLLKEYKHV